MRHDFIPGGLHYMDLKENRVDYHGDDRLVRIALDQQRFAYLADHRVQDVPVLPGAFYVDAALAATPRAPIGTIRDVRFERAFILPDEPTGQASLEIVDERAGATGRLTFRSAPGGGTEPIRHATLVVEPAKAGDGPAGGDPGPDRPAGQELDHTAFYEWLGANGNQYGPSFRSIERVVRDDERAEGWLGLPADAAAELDRHHLHPVFLDGCIQALAAIHLDQSRTFLLEGIDRVSLDGRAVPRCRVEARLTARGRTPGEPMAGEVRAVADDGTRILTLEGVRFRLLERQLDARPDRSAMPSATMAISATFTAEPLEDTLRFWGDQFGLALEPVFAPFNQVFQELLSPDSALGANRDGANVTLIRLEDWSQQGRPAADRSSGLPARPALPAGLDGHRLPNGLEIAHVNRYETEYLFKEIFDDRAYLRHGISLDGAGCVIDIGANIGMFTMFVQHHCPDARIFSFEPGPKVFRALEHNSRLLGANAKAFPYGVSDARGTAEFTFYEHSTVFSTFSADEADDQAAIRAVIENMVREGAGADGAADAEVDRIVDGLLGQRLESETVRCELVSVSDIIRDNGIERIDLLKIDAEKSELPILAGIDDADWPKIRQIVIEVHDKVGDRIKEVLALLERRGFEFQMTEEDLLQGSGLYNIYAVQRGQRATSERQEAVLSRTDRERITRAVEDFLAAARSFASRSTLPHLVAFCPPSPKLQENDADLAFLEQVEARVAADLADQTGVHVITSHALLERYPVAERHDAAGDLAGRVPYTPVFYSALATSLFRTWQASRRAPVKVIALDCDNTLWKGVCGEDGPDGIEIDPPRRRLQEFVKRRIADGMIVCLCSKNVEADVMAVFEARSEMPLALDDLVAWRINWQPKSANLISLAEELNLGLDSFVFIDDSPIDCAEVRANCPTVLTLTLPAQAPETIGAFLDHVWAFDQLRVTEEGRQRTRLYKEQAKRESLRSSSLTMAEFLDKLELDVRIAPLAPSDLERVADLTRRTNQFNFSTVRRSASEIRALLDDGTLEALVVRVSDRFGDYGLVGVLLLGTTNEALVVDTMLLSCRVLGRGVEHRMLRQASELAEARGRSQVLIPYRKTAKNVPARQFLEAVAGGYLEGSLEGEAVFRVP
ncbi:MAG: FkbM family methyltransferase, partial [Geminicoccaceae bacterium]|nr:FkbM family methyltransferase [Geminicoccaceae bacterium]